MKHLPRAAFSLLVIIAALIAAPAVAAYEGEVDVQVAVNGPTTTQCPNPVEITATVVDGNGNPLANQEVVWSTGEKGMTNAKGVVKATVLVSDDITVTATSGESSAQITITCVASTITLPRTDTEAPGPSPLVPALLALGLLSLVAARRLAVAAARR